MKRLFVETRDFRNKIDKLNEKGLLIRIQNQILKDVNCGVIVTGTGGIRKFRTAAKGKGKSGGIRVFYLDMPLKEKCYLLYLIEKSENDNINLSEKIELKKLVEKLKGF